jgi:acid stress chaperone HdeB
MNLGVTMKGSDVARILVLTLAFSVPAKAQVVLDLSLITCKQFLTSDPEKQALIGSWMSGYFSATKNLNILDFRYVERNRKVVGNYCKGHKSDTLMSAMQKNWR